ncbi:hypothetical protein [Nocardia asiatica]|uniref:hypothetical protein n=1 Tax=Nocardia asiatica TaxID=209252 RepID=UPI0012F7BA86|nr:hypothetical protein [Nocardia asiatica]
MTAPSARSGLPHEGLLFTELIEGAALFRSGIAGHADPDPTTPSSRPPSVYRLRSGAAASASAISGTTALDPATPYNPKRQWVSAYSADLAALSAPAIAGHWRDRVLFIDIDVARAIKGIADTLTGSSELAPIRPSFPAAESQPCCISLPKFVHVMQIMFVAKLPDQTAWIRR